MRVFHRFARIGGMFVLSLGLAATADAKQASSVVRVETGLLRGVLDENVTRFYGVP